MWLSGVPAAKIAETAFCRIHRLSRPAECLTAEQQSTGNLRAELVSSCLDEVCFSLQ